MPRQLVLETIRSLSPTGTEGFEGLIRDLLSCLSGKQFYLCKSGSQHGIDALADSIPVSIECKRYGERNSLNLRELEGELSAAVRTYHRLQLWVLACSVECSAQDREALRTAGENQGIATLILDASIANPFLPGVPQISALLAVDPPKALFALSHTANTSSLGSIQRELETIKAMPDFDQWSLDFKNKLLESPIWSMVVQRQNSRLTKIITGASRVRLGTHFAPNAVVVRTIQNDLDQWFDAGSHSNGEPLAVVQGERYDGKTWCILNWLVSRLPTLLLPVFFVSSQQGMESVGLFEHFLSETKELLGSYYRHAESVLRRTLDRSQSDQPWCLFVIDGLNEYPDPHRCVRHILDALSCDSDRRRALVLATARTNSWRALQEGIPQNIRTRVLTVGPYNEAEFQNALVMKGLPASYPDLLPNTAQTMIRRPRFLDLVVSHSAKLTEYEGVTAGVLYWLDACDKLRDHSASQAQLDVSGYQALLRGLAARFVSSLCVTDRDIRETLSILTSDPRVALRDLESEGVLSNDLRGYKINSDRLALGMGLHLLASLLTAHERQQPLQECLHDLLSPLQETDEMVMRLRTAAEIALVQDPPIPSSIIDLLVGEWLSSRNLDDTDLQDIKAMRRLLFAPLLRIAPNTWSRAKGNERLQELSRMVFVDALSWGRAQIRQAITSWFRMVPERGSSFVQKVKEDKHEDPIHMVREVLEDPLLADLQLVPSKDEGILKLHKLGLHLLGQDPCLAGPTDLLALIAAELAAWSDMGDAERLIFRRSLASVEVSWFQNQCLNLASNGASSRRRKIFHWLTVRAQRADLESIVRDTAPPPDPELESFRSSVGPLSQEAYDDVRNKEFLPGENPGRFAEFVRELVKNPTLLSPCAQRLSAIESALCEYFTRCLLYQGLNKDIHDHMFEQVLPTIGAWFPTIAKEILDRHIRLLPNKEPRGRVLSHVLSRHAILLDSESRSILKSLAHECGTGTTEGKWIAENLLLVVLPSMSGSEQVKAITEREDWNWEWTKLYDLVAFLTESASPYGLLQQLRLEGDSLRAKRSRFLLAHIGGYTLGDEDAHLLRGSIQQGGEDCFSALWLAARGQYYNLPPELLVPIAIERGSEQQLSSAYASILLLNSGSAKTVSYDDWPSQLAPQWRVEAAVQHSVFRQNVVNEIEHSLKLLLQSERDLESNRTLLFPAPISVEPFDLSKGFGRYSISKYTCEKSLYWKSPESTVGGLAQNNSLQPALERLAVNHDEAIRQMNELNKESMRVAHQRSLEHSTCWSATEFPMGLLEQVERKDPARLSKWLGWLHGNSVRARAFWGGLLHSLFIFFLRNGDSRAREIWTMVYPFDRNNKFNTTTFSIQGVNSLFFHLSDIQSDESLSCTFLEELVLDVRTDWELFSMVLGARLQSQTRLSKITRNLLSDTDFEKRARGSRLAGWLEGFETDLHRIISEDPSLWVREVASLALQSTTEEAWAHQWFNKVLLQSDQYARWGASQLFLACVDERSITWAFGKLNNANIQEQTRGEAWLLLDEAARISEKKAKDLKEVFLKHKVRDLENVCHPWRSTFDWEEINHG